MATLDTPLVEIVGGKTAKVLEQALDLSTAGALLRHYPRRFAERGELTDLSRLIEGEQVTVQAEIVGASVKHIKARRLKILEVQIASGQSRASLTFFNQPWRDRDLKPGRRGLFAGKVSRFRDQLKLNNPDYVLLDGGPLDGGPLDGGLLDGGPLDGGLLNGDSAVGDSPEHRSDAAVEEFAGSLIPIYPAAGTIRSWTIAKCVKLVLDALDPPTDPLPTAVRTRLQLVDYVTALRDIHRPQTRSDHRQARARLAFDEAFGVQLIMAQRRSRIAANPAVSRPARSNGLVDAFAERLPFTLTEEQQQIASLLSEELAAEHPMHRLLQGEVGSGKTVLALLAMLQVVDAGGQAALLAPTEVLASQHLETINDLLGPLARAGQIFGDERGTKLTLLTGALSASARRAALLDAASGSAGIVIGTHALIQDQVQFADLGMVVVDEQHRFGVEQRDALRSKAAAPPHMLVMTATPIPRTIAMTAFGDLEVSELRTLPAGRQATKTQVVALAEHPNWSDRVWQRVREEAAASQQAYVVCARIGEQDDLDDIGADSDDEPTQAASVLGTYAELSGAVLPDLRLSLLHGALPVDEKSAVMRAFAQGDSDVLVATTVIEVGINVPNANLMVILDADRFGISQLHQLRGRVGRGGAEGLCLLVTRMPDGHPARLRLDAVAATTNGFELAEADLRQRREGDVLGATQSGRNSHLKLLSLLDDLPIIEAARIEARRIIEVDPGLEMHPALNVFLWDHLDSERTDFLQKS